ncbi:FkbM family methyltransferase [Xenophilus aerolatus]|nr:FkbM family methyltransferase [Xenophilus aerolatus]
MSQQPPLPAAFASRFVSYAQNWEDVMLWRALRHVSPGFYIDVGAQSPDTDSVTRAFSQSGWRGINVEPHPVYLEQLKERRPEDINLGVAVGVVAGRLSMSLVDGTGLSTADAQLMQQHAAAGYTLRQHEVDVLTLAEIWRRHVPEGQPVHFLKVDVEGLEKAVLEGADWVQQRPWIVVVEAMLPNEQVECHEQWEPLLLDARYEFVYADGLNRFYVAEEHPELAGAFRYPPNVFDNHVSVALSEYEIRCDAQAEALQRLSEQHVHMDAQLDSLGRSLGEAHGRIEVTEASAIRARERAMALQDQLELERATLNRSIQERDQLLAESRRRVTAVEEERAALLQSPWWRVTGPFRRLGGALPAPVRRGVRSAAYWVRTPHKIPSRLAAIGAARAAQRRNAARPPLNLYPAEAPGRPAEPPVPEPVAAVRDRASAIQWCVDVLRGHPEVRQRFPQALSNPELGFAQWVRGEGGVQFRLDGEARAQVLDALGARPAERVRTYLQSRPDVLASFPLGLQVAGQDAIYRWFANFGCAESGLTVGEVLWALMLEREEAMDTRGEQTR